MYIIKTLNIYCHVIQDLNNKPSTN